MGTPFLFFNILSLIFISTTNLGFSSSSDLTNLVFKGCANQNFQDPLSSQTLKTLYSTLLSQSSTNKFYKTTVGGQGQGQGQSSSSITGLYQCRGDLSNSDCNKCVEKLPETVKRVCGGNTVAARAQLGGCYMRYEVAEFRQASGTELLYKQCGSSQASGAGFEERLNTALGEIAKGVSSGNGFYAGGYQSVYVLGQCEGDLSNGDCVNCVKSATERSKSECGSAISGHIYLQTCYISYTYYPDGVGSGNSPSGITLGMTDRGTGRGHNTQKTVAIVVGGVVGVGLGVACLLVLKSALKKKKDKYGGY